MTEDQQKKNDFAISLMESKIAEIRSGTVNAIALSVSGYDDEGESEITIQTRPVEPIVE